MRRPGAAGGAWFVSTYGVVGTYPILYVVFESSGMMMEAISWKEMRCLVTMAKEGRKVAKPRLG
jgi:hypothetical protein